MIKIYTTV